uniref:Uncharacterized protein n=1 Tax=Bacillus pumilus TaxID=1408 RepID=A0A385EK68_BACPU|nr:hypothetical protein [Bacillus pumilus]
MSCFYMYQDKKRHDSDSVKIAQKAGETAIFLKDQNPKT